MSETGLRSTKRVTEQAHYGHSRYRSNDHVPGGASNDILASGETDDELDTSLPQDEADILNVGNKYFSTDGQLCGRIQFRDGLVQVITWIPDTSDPPRPRRRPLDERVRNAEDKIQRLRHEMYNSQQRDRGVCRREVGDIRGILDSLLRSQTQTPEMSCVESSAMAQVGGSAGAERPHADLLQRLEGFELKLDELKESFDKQFSVLRQEMVDVLAQSSGQSGADTEIHGVAKNEGNGVLTETTNWVGGANRLDAVMSDAESGSFYR